MKKRFPLTVVIILATAYGCATDDPNKRAKIGAGVGAVVGGIVGRGIDDGGTGGTIVGAAAGGALGGLVGNHMDKQQQELEAAVAAQAAAAQVEVERIDEDTIRLTMPSEVLFGVNQDEVTSDFYPALDSISNVLAQHGNESVRVIGHADSTGKEDYNLRLSQRRASNVVRYLRGNGVERLHSEGRGEREPRADNATAEGRALNRRVELILSGGQA